MTHELKCWPSSFRLIARGIKKYEIRKDDRGFDVGDYLWLREYIPESISYTGKELFMKISFKTENGEFGLPSDLCIMLIEFPSIDDFEENKSITKSKKNTDSIFLKKLKRNSKLNGCIGTRSV